MALGPSLELVNHRREQAALVGVEFPQTSRADRLAERVGHRASLETLGDLGVRCRGSHRGNLSPLIVPSGETRVRPGFSYV